MWKGSVEGGYVRKSPAESALFSGAMINLHRREVGQNNTSLKFRGEDAKEDDGKVLWKKNILLVNN